MTHQRPTGGCQCGGVRYALYAAPRADTPDNWIQTRRTT